MRPHPDDGTLALHALGEPALTGEDVEHVRACEECARTVEELAGTVDVVRGPRSRDLEAVPVPDRVWDGIAASLELSPGVRPTGRPAPGGSAPAAGGDAPAAGGDAPAPSGTGPLGGDPAARSGHGATAVPVASSEPAPAVASLADARARRRGPWSLLAVAAAGVLVGAAGTVLVTGLPGSDPGEETAVLAAAELQEFGVGEGTGVAGSARLVATPATAGDEGADLRGRTLLRVRLDGVPDTGEDFLEAWLIDADTGAMVSLGPLPSGNGGPATVDLYVPEGVDVTRFDLVDVSSEPPDGDPTHSGASLVRGTLEL